MKLGTDPTHLIVRDLAMKALQADNVFWKESLLAGTLFEPYMGAIHWNVIRDMAETDMGEKLVPVAEGNGWDPTIQPEKFLPSSHRRTAGYSRASALDPAVAALHVQRRINWTAGCIGSVNRVIESYTKQGLPVPAIVVPQLMIATTA